tara:strand:+ start:1232 stop:1372 length:141 start_codon:yes stop_codon:yes gene_type:complete
MELQTENNDYIKQSTLLSEMFAAGLIEPEEYHEQMMVISDKAWSQS